MKYIGLSVYDSKALFFSPPFFAPNIGSGIRSWGDEVRNPLTPWSKHPGDYQLYEIGTYDSDTGLLSSLVPMKLLASATEFSNSPRVSDVASDLLKEVVADGKE